MAAAPLLGGYLNHMYGFRSNFLAIAIFVLISFIVCQFFFEETLPKKKIAFSDQKASDRFSKSLHECSLLAITMVISLIFAGYLVFLSISSVLSFWNLESIKCTFPTTKPRSWVLGLSQVLSTRAALKNWVSTHQNHRNELHRLSGLWVVGASLLYPQNAILITSGMVIYTFGANWIQGLYFPEGMEIFPDIKGITASL